jgi:hypothetical protein
MLNAIRSQWIDGFSLQFKTQASLIQDVPGGKDNILGGHSIGHSKQKTLCENFSHFSGLAWAPNIVLPSRPAAGGKVNILGGHSIGHSKQKTL